MQDLARIKPAQWRALSERTIYFGHQSVGENILDGMQKVAAQQPELKLTVSKGATNPSPGVLNEFAIGENGDTASKNAAFVHALETPLARRPVLLFKYCYVDVDDKTDAKALFESYRDTVATVRKRHPDAVVIHVTMPLTTDSALRDFINRVRGRPTRKDRNSVRSAYNELLLDAYAGKEPIYDLAEVESTRSDGSREFSTVEGRRVFALAPEWASDDGHLNDAGRRRAASRLLATLASLP